MSGQPLERRLAENEAIFREFNEKALEGVEQVRKDSMDTGDSPIELEDDTKLYFFCECSDENCKEKVRISPGEYKRVHIARDNFTLVCGHEQLEIEEVTSTKDEYCVVTKKVPAPEHPQKLNTTPTP